MIAMLSQSIAPSVAVDESAKSPVRRAKGFTWIGGLIALLLFVRLIAPVPHLRFVSDDYLLLVEDANLPWYDSNDHLYRVLRNGVCRIMPKLFGMQPEPHHLLGLAAYTGCLGLLSLFLYFEGAGMVGIAGAVTLVAL